jgi:hypothetical protein
VPEEAGGELLRRGLRTLTTESTEGTERGAPCAARSTLAGSAVSAFFFVNALEESPMAKGQHLSAYQKRIVNRYYQHLDTISVNKVAEAATELYLCTDPKKADKLWVSVEKALDKTAASDAAVQRILKTRDIKALAELVGKLSR